MQLLGMSAIITSLSGYPDKALGLVLPFQELVSAVFAAFAGGGSIS